MLLQSGRLGRVYVKPETTFGTAVTLAGSDAVRHINVGLNVKKHNRVNSEERHAHPSQLYRYTRKRSANWSLSGIFHPAGTINTLPDHDPILEYGFGAKTNVTLSTTIASGSTAGGATLTSAAGLAVGDPILINVTTGSPATGRVVRFLTSVAGAVVTWAPDLPQAAAVSDTVKGCIGYKLTTAAPGTLDIAHYLTSLNYESRAAAVETLKLTFDANSEVMWEASGPMADRIRPAQADPVTFTTVGTTPPSGITGSLRVGTTAEDFIKAEIEIKNGFELDNRPFGIAVAQALYRATRRSVMINLNTMVGDDVTLLDASESKADLTTLIQCGATEGSIIAIFAPALELEEPDDPSGDGFMEWAYKATAKGLVGNDELRLAVA